MSSQPPKTVVALDVGERRIGVAVANTEAKIAAPLVTLEHNDAIFSQIQTLLAEQHAAAVVLGLPRGLDGQETAQTHAVQAFAGELKMHISLPIFWQDEAVTSRQAEAELVSRGKSFAKGDIDTLAATYILEDFLLEQLPEAKL